MDSEDRGRRLTVVLCVRCTSPAFVHSVTRTCIECRASVWVSMATVELAVRERAFYVCTECIPALGDANEVFKAKPPTPEQLLEMEPHR